MPYLGRMIAGVIAIGTILFVVGLSYWSNETHNWMYTSIGTAIWTAVALPLAWIIGRKFDRLTMISFIDCLTGIHNRRFIETSFQRLSLRAKRKSKRMTIILIDVNDFKDINDRFGHARGDIALKLISQTLKECSKRGEIVARWGGDEFMMICPYADVKSIEKLTLMLHEQLMKLSYQSGLKLSVSIGSVYCPEEGMELTQLIQIADKRMYDEKMLMKRKAGELEIKQA